jgi:hypothetical protein
MKKINLLMVIMLWVFAHVLVYNTHHYLVGIYGHYIHLMLAVFLLAVYVHYRLFAHMTSKISTYL